jgi:2,4-dienoyl-CoA reductase-like NADH-dependent reductase (Old Yellow Enzyme family)
VPGQLDHATSDDMVGPRARSNDCPAEPYAPNRQPISPSLSIETIEPCRICSPSFASATLTSPTASAFRRCANILRPTATQTIGISPILPRAQSAAQGWCSRRPPRSRPRAGFRHRISAPGAKGISSRSSGSRASSVLKARAGIQLAHAGRKGSTYRPGTGQGAVSESAGGWRPVAPSAIAFSDSYARPDELTADQIKSLQTAFAIAAERAASAGFAVIEIHAAHGYLIHEFLSPLSNRRTDAYGSSFDNRTRFLRECVAEVRRVLPEGSPLFVRISATDWAEGGWDIDQSVELARLLLALGVDVIDCSSGGNLEKADIPVGAGYQTPFAERIRREANIATAAVGMITVSAQADQIIRNEQADLVLLAREMLRDPYWPLHAAQELGQTASWPRQYLRAAPSGTPERVVASALADRAKQTFAS